MKISINKMTSEEFNQLTSRENWGMASTISRLNLWDERRCLMTGKCRQSVVESPGFIDGAMIDLISRAPRLF